MTLLISTYLLLLSGIAVSYLGGLAVIGNNARRPADSFLKLFTGLVLIVSLFALFRTGGQSILLGILLLLLFLAAAPSADRSLVRALSADRVFLLGTALVATLFYLVRAKMYFADPAMALVPNYDTICHVRRAMFFDLAGIENVNTNIYQFPDGTNPYHYFEAWFIALFGSLSGLNFWAVAQLVMLPMLAGTMVGGLASFFAKDRLAAAFIFCAILPLMGGFYVAPMFESSSFFSHAEKLVSNAFDEPWSVKLSVAFIFYLAGWHCLRANRTLAAAAAFLMLPIASINTAPVLLMSLVAFGLIGMLFGLLDRSIRNALAFLLMPVAVFAFIQLFYLLTGSSEEYIAEPNLTAKLMDLLRPTRLRSALIITAEQLIYFALFFLPLLLILLLGIIGRLLPADNGRATSICLFTALLFINGSFFFNLMKGSFGDKDFLLYPLLPMLAILLGLSLVSMIMNAGFPQMRFVGLLIWIGSLFFFIQRSSDSYERILSFRFNYDPAYLAEVRERVKSCENRNGLVWELPEEVEFPWYNDGNQRYGSYLYAFIDESFSLNAINRNSLPEILPESGYRESAVNFLRASAFYRYTQASKAADPELSESEIQRKFIEENGIGYLLLSPRSEVPAWLNEMAESVIRDPKSGEGFLLLRKVQ